MEKKIITFTANEQSLRKTGGIPNYASNKVSYIEAQFELGENWQGFDAVRAIWYNKAQTISMVLADGKCIVPYEVLANKGQVMVNLVGSISENDVLTDRLTTYPVVALIVDADAKVDGSNTQPITPSQFEQFVEAVKADAESASESAESASASAESAHDDKIEIEQKIAEVIQQIEDFEQVEVVVNTLPAGSQATSDFTDGVLTLGIPQGAKGDTGNGIASCVLNPDYTLTINFTDGTSYTTASIRGAQGVKGDTGNGISSITKTSSETVDGRVVDTYTTTFTDGETTEFEVTNGKDGEVTMSQLSALLPTDTASGDIASFPDGQSIIPALSVKITLEPIQDLHGYDKPWSGGNGKNKVDYLSCVGVGTRNDTDSVSASVSVSSDVITLTGSASYNNGGMIFKGIGSPSITGAFTVSADVKCTAGTVAFGVGAYEGGGTSDVNSNYVVTANTWTHISRTFTDKTYAKMGIFLQPKADANVLEVKNLQLELGSTATSYEPYSNICPISGRTDVVTQRTGVNVWDEEWEHGYYSRATGNKAGNSDTTYFRSKNFIPCLPSTTYYIKQPAVHASNSTFCGLLFYDVDQNYISSRTESTSRTFTTPSNTYYMTFYIEVGASGATYQHDISINYPSTDTDYHAYLGTSYTTTLGRTVYGGTLDVVSGELVVDRAYTEISEDWTWYRSSSYQGGYYADRMNSLGYKPYCLLKSSHAKGTQAINEYVMGTCYCDYSINFRIMSETSTLQEWKDYIVAQRSNGTPITICYELATPQTYQLTPTEVDLLLGQNNVWTDCGSVEVTYKADIERWVNKKINALI